MALSLNLRTGAALLSSLSLLAACAQTHDPTVDLEGKDGAAHEADVAECREYAEPDAAMKRAFAHTGRGPSPRAIPAEPDPAKQRAFAAFLLGGLFYAGLSTGIGAVAGSLVGAARSAAGSGAASGAAQGAAVYGTAAGIAAGASGVQEKAEINKNCPLEPL